MTSSSISCSTSSALMSPEDTFRVGNRPPTVDQLNCYLSGFVDGEGCFCVSFQPSRRHRLGWEVRPSFSVSQNQGRAQLLFWLAKHWQCGSIRPDRSDNTLKFEVRALDDLVGTVVPHFEAYPLWSAKQQDVQVFTAVCRSIAAGRHRCLEGLEEIARLAMLMNPSGKRRYRIDDIVRTVAA